MNLIKFGSYSPPSPTKYSLTLQDIDSEDTGRGESGYMVRERIREGIYKLSLTFTNISSDDVVSIKSSISNSSVNVTLFDGGEVTAKMYVGDRQLELKSIDDDANCFWDMSFSLTEY